MNTATQELLDSEMEVLEGNIISVRFHNPTSGWSVLSVYKNGYIVTAVGSLINPKEGDEYSFSGRWTNHSRFGAQFQFERAELKLPSTRKGIIRYLSSTAYGVGEVRASKIVDTLGENCLEKLQENPDLLNNLDFLTAGQCEEIKRHLRTNKTLAELSALICREGITPSLAAKIVARYGQEAVNLVKENPYRLAEDIEQVGFLIADRIAKAVGVAPNSPYRVQAAVKHILKEAENEGHCYLRPNDFGRKIPELLGPGISVPEIAGAVRTLIDAGLLVRDGDDIYLTEMYRSEVRLAAKMRALADQRPREILELEVLIDEEQAQRGIIYHQKQRQAIAAALKNGLSIITGGPGTGKTEISKGIIGIYKTLDRRKPVYLCSPTGRAAKRLSEATGKEAKTIHRLLDYHPEIGFRVNTYNQLSPGLLLVDEFSMADLPLADALFQACPEDMQVVLIGDVDQLPSVRPGNVLRDAINSGIISTVRLEFIYRQEEGSGISALAHQINQGIMPNLAGGRDVTVIQISSPDEAMPLAVNFAKQAYEQYGPLGFNVLAPMHKGSSGIKALNEAIRTALNPGKGSWYRAGDKVMVIKNSYQWDIFNGDIGVIREVKDDRITVDFGDKIVEFENEDDGDCASLDLLQLAWASTVHKAQGSEYPACIVVFTNQHWIMLTRNLLYTSITRAKKHLVLICQAQAVEKAVKNNRIEARNSRLAKRLQEG